MDLMVYIMLGVVKVFRFIRVFIYVMTITVSFGGASYGI